MKCEGMEIPSQEWLDSVAQSNVDVIETSLNADPEFHAMEVEGEHWEIELGERPAAEIVMTILGPGTQFIFAMALADRHHPHLFDGSDGV